MSINIDHILNLDDREFNKYIDDFTSGLPDDLSSIRSRSRSKSKTRSKSRSSSRSKSPKSPAKSPKSRKRTKSRSGGSRSKSSRQKYIEDFVHDMITFSKLSESSRSNYKCLVPPPGKNDATFREFADTFFRNGVFQGPQPITKRLADAGIHYRKYDKEKKGGNSWRNALSLGPVLQRVGYRTGQATFTDDILKLLE